MKKALFPIIIILALTGAAYWAYQRTVEGEKDNSSQESNVVLEQNVLKPLDATYLIEDDPVTLDNGKAQKEIASGSASKIEVAVLGEPIRGDINNDGISDAALILTYSAGGSGTFYYLVAAVYDFDMKKTVGTNGILLGDRIEVKSIAIEQKEVIADYLVRKNDDPMHVMPSVVIAKRFKTEGYSLKETTDGAIIKEQSCIISGGAIKESLCCNSTHDFPSSCLIGPCGCSLSQSHQVRVCDCGIDQCFDGKECVDISDNLKL